MFCVFYHNEPDDLSRKPGVYSRRGSPQLIGDMVRLLISRHTAMDVGVIVCCSFFAKYK